MPITRAPDSAHRANAARRLAARLHLVTVDDRGELGVVDLHRGVDHVAGDDRPLTGRFDDDGDVPGGVPRGRLEPHVVADAMVDGHQVGQAGFVDGGHRVTEHVVAEEVGGGLPVLVLGPGEQVAGVGERRQPPAVDQTGVPADVVDVQVGADHLGDRFRRVARCGQVRKERQLQVVPVGAVAHLVVADAGVDRDAVIADVDHEALDAHQEVAVVADEVGTEPAGGLGAGEHVVLAEALEQEPRRRRSLALGNGRDRRVADLPLQHVRVPPSARQLEPSILRRPAARRTVLHRPVPDPVGVVGTRRACPAPTSGPTCTARRAPAGSPGRLRWPRSRTSAGGRCTGGARATRAPPGG